MSPFVILGFLLFVVLALFWFSRTLPSPSGESRKTIDQLLSDNRELIEEHLSNVEPQWSFDRELDECLKRLILKERWLNMFVTSSMMEPFEQDKADFERLKTRLHSLFAERVALVAKNRRDAAEEARKRRLAEMRGLLTEHHSDLLAKFFDIAERKVSVLDEYGDEDWDALEKEVTACSRKIQQRGVVNVGWDEEGLLELVLRELFKEFRAQHKAAFSDDMHLDQMSGVEFEAWLCARLKNAGYEEVRGTPGSGDQGADILAMKSGRLIAMQAKRSRTPVGNGAVQEVLAAVVFYGTDEGWVITNATFTPSAMALAQKCGVVLVDGMMLRRGWPREGASDSERRADGGAGA